MKLALFGGTFDPVHRGHLAVARAAATKFDLQLVHFVPATLPPHKSNRVLTDFHHRFAMLALATAEEERFVPSLMEAGASEPNYSIQTVRRLKSTLKKSDKLFFIIGIDAFMEVSTWKQPVQLLGECDFIVVSRPGYSLADAAEALPEALRPSADALQTLRKRPSAETISLPSTTIRLLSGVAEKISSTEVRAAAAKSLKQLRHYVPETVARYIKKERLYASPSAQPENSSGERAKVLSFRGTHSAGHKGRE
jgi:nicotinate-nucleotide adenylyltransferase